MYYSYCESPIGPLLLTGDRNELSGLFFSTGSKARGADESWERYDEPFRKAAKQIEQYFSGQRKSFDLDLAPHGTEFQLDVLTALLEIPFGETRSYADIAERVGRPKAVRAVGAANGRNPIALIIPCHRVIGKNGSLTGFGGGLDAKQYLLEHELGRSGLFA
ncbi:MAG: methylated-DNA--[protein]-cysteine S-methyltransferase [Pseudomonadales bacterium]|nr:methylated-DNA--[protein]-cysteine S-methyltransferase [Pseudomonadales bacterium]